MTFCLMKVLFLDGMQNCIAAFTFALNISILSELCSFDNFMKVLGIFCV